MTMTDEQRREIFEEYTSKYYDGMLGLIRKYGVDDDDIEDVRQEALIRIWRFLPSFDGRCKFKNWAHSIIRNETWTFLRKRRMMQLRKDAVRVRAETCIFESKCCMPTHPLIVEQLVDKVGAPLAAVAIAKFAGYTPGELWPDATIGNAKNAMTRSFNLIQRVMKNAVLSDAERERVRMSLSATKAGRGGLRSLCYHAHDTHEGGECESRDGSENSPSTSQRRTDCLSSGACDSGDSCNYRIDSDELQGGDIRVTP